MFDNVVYNKQVVFQKFYRFFENLYLLRTSMLKSCHSFVLAAVFRSQYFWRLFMLAPVHLGVNFFAAVHFGPVTLWSVVFPQLILAAVILVPIFLAAVILVPVISTVKLHLNS